MTIEIPKEIRTAAITSIERYFREYMDEPIGNVAAGGLFSFFVEEFGPVIYNKAVTDVQQHLVAKITDLDIDIHEDEFQYWRKFDSKKKMR